MSKRKALEIKKIDPKQWVYFNLPSITAISLLIPVWMDRYANIKEYAHNVLSIFITALAILFLQVFLINKNIKLIGSGPILEVEEEELPDLTQWEPN